MKFIEIKEKTENGYTGRFISLDHAICITFCEEDGYSIYINNGRHGTQRIDFEKKREYNKLVKRIKLILRAIEA